MTRILPIVLFLSIGCDTPTKQDVKSSQSTPSVQASPATVENSKQAELLMAQIIKTARLERELIALGVVKPEDKMNVKEMLEMSTYYLLEQLMDHLKVMARVHTTNRALVKKIGIQKFREKRAAEAAERAALG